METPSQTQLFAERLKQARAMRGLSLRGLVDAMSQAVSVNALNKYETGQMRPSPTVLHALCAALGVEEDFFRRPMQVSLGEVKFRKRSSLRAKDETALRLKATDFFERYAELEDLLGLNAPFENPVADLVIAAPEDVETAAEKVRKAWKLGEAPIQSVIGLLEMAHIMIYSEAAPESFDGFAGKAGDRDVVALNDSFPVDRRRFSALHELGHVILNMEPDRFSEKEENALCNRFAGAMLIPRSLFRRVFGGHRQHITVQELVQLKGVFGISCAAIMKRAGDLDLMAPSTLERFWTSWGARNYRKNDPGACDFTEIPRRFDVLLQRAVAENRLSHAKAAYLAGVPEEEFRASIEIFP